VLAVAWALAAVASTVASTQEAKTFYGEISDSQCALNVHSLTRGSRGNADARASAAPEKSNVSAA